MPRPLFYLAILSLWAGEIQGRTISAPAARDQEEKPQAPEPAKFRTTRRVLFRTDSARLFVPTIPKPSAPPTTPAHVEREKPRSVAPAPKPRPVEPISPPPEPKRTPAAPAQGRPELDLQPTSFTPYDPYLGSVRSVISRLDNRGTTMATACDLVRAGRQFRYLVTDPYRAQPPAVTEARHAGDCKSKALWLYENLGDRSAYFVIGKLERRSRTSHAWVYWRNAGRWWILDPTDRATPISADSVASSRYVPYYSYSPSGTFRHKATSLMLAMANGIPAVPSEPAVAVRSRSGGVKIATRQTRR